MSLAYPFLMAYVLDLLLGDPPGWPHPIRCMGRLSQCWERIFYRPSILAGGLFWAGFTGSILAMTIVVLKALAYLPAPLGGCGQVYLMYACLATRSLHKESRVVEQALIRGDLDGARRWLSCIVGRQTSHLPAEEIRRAVIETIAENLSDGVVAPIFYGILLGVPGMILYKGINTLDSMVGYRNDRYANFGRVAARADDIVNFLPARLTASLMAIIASIVALDSLSTWRVLQRDSHKASSPNAGWPEAAMAGALGVRLGGPSVYFGSKVEKPFIGDATHPLGKGDYDRAVRLLYGTSLLMAVMAFALLLWSGATTWGLLGLLRI
jgi:adenosylcobinamide-phosphate synthase